jgi:transcriptional regulator with XRE-family HTH domain
MQEHHDDICKALRTWRIRSRLQQAAIAECLGVTQSQISRWESGRDTPRPHNVEAIRRLVWGAEAEPLQALKHFVQSSSQLLMLIDAENGIIARSEPLRRSPNLMDRFGWVLDPETNPAFAPAWRRFNAILSQPDGVVGMTVTMPFTHDGEHWSVTIRNTIYSVSGLRVCLAEPCFNHCRSAGEIRFEEVRIGMDEEERRKLTLWQA